VKFGLRAQEFHGNGVVRHIPVDMRGMHIASTLEADLGVRIFLVHIRLAGDADRYFLVAYGDGVLVVVVQNDRISGRNFHLRYLHIVILEGEMVVRLLVHRNDIRSLR
jgi:hypothetical protein